MAKSAAAAARPTSGLRESWADVCERFWHAWISATRFGSDGRIERYERFEAATRYKHPIDSILENLLARMEETGDREHYVWDRVYAEIRGRKNFSEAISPYVPSAERAMIAVGEQSGDWVMGFAEAKFIAEVTAKIKSALISALFYPVILILFAVVIMAAIAIEVVPNLKLMLDRPVEEWPAPTYWLNWVGQSVLDWGVIGGGAIFAVLVLSLWSLPRRGSLAWFHSRRSFIDKWLPPYTIYREYQASAFLISLSALLRAGRPIEAALGDLANIASPWLRAHIRIMTRRVMESVPVGNALDTGLIAPPVVAYIKDFDRYGSFKDGLDVVGRRGVDRAIARVTSQANVLRNMALVIVLGMMGLIYAGMIAPGYQMFVESQSMGGR